MCIRQYNETHERTHSAGRAGCPLVCNQRLRRSLLGCQADQGVPVYLEPQGAQDVQRFH